MKPRYYSICDHKNIKIKEYSTVLCGIEKFFYDKMYDSLYFSFVYRVRKFKGKWMKILSYTGSPDEMW